MSTLGRACGTHESNADPLAIMRAKCGYSITGDLSCVMQNSYIRTYKNSEMDRFMPAGFVRTCACVHAGLSTSAQLECIWMYCKQNVQFHWQMQLYEYYHRLPIILYPSRIWTLHHWAPRVVRLHYPERSTRWAHRDSSKHRLRQGNQAWVRKRPAATNSFLSPHLDPLKIIPICL